MDVTLSTDDAFGEPAASVRTGTLAGFVVAAPPRASGAVPWSASIAVDIPVDVGLRLERVGRTYRATLWETTYAAFATLLHRYTGETDLIVEASRPPALSTPVRMDVSGDPPFRALARANAALWPVLAEREPQQADAARAFALTFDVRDACVADPPSPSGGCEVRLTARLEGDALALAWTHRGDLVRRDTLERIGEHFRELLSAICEAPDTPLSRLRLLSDIESRRIVALGRGDERPYERDETVDRLFALQARRTPGAIALSAGSGDVTYGELELRANRFANYLRSRGVNSGSLVGVALDRSPDVPVALLAILKAGGTYVPLDAEYPRDRLAYMIADAGVAFLVTLGYFCSRLLPQGVVTICVDDDANAISACGSCAPEVASQPEPAAYVTYTSGSTGRPKGVAVTHRGVVRLVRETDYLVLRADDALLHVSPLAFDASTFEIWAPLLNGARLAIPRAGLLSVADLGRAVERYAVTTMFLTTSLFQRVVEHEASPFGRMRRVLTGGEVASPRHIARFLQLFPGCKLLAVYGPTENTTFSTWYDIDSEAAIGDRVPIGRPIAHSTAHVVDAHLQVLPLGVPGELCVGGDGVALGYLNLPELTAERFAPDPYANVAGASLYRTGDRARLRSDGAIEFLGRTDDQVKIRGFRIELGEIESVLKSHADVADAAVVVPVAADKTLCAYTARANGATVDERGLRAYLKTKLPAYMLPHRIVLVDRLPETKNGKVDRGALAGRPEPFAGATSATASPDSPGRVLRPPNGTDPALLSEIGEVWREVLGGERSPAMDDNFFDAGGDSLQLLTVHLLLQERLRVGLQIMDLFKHATIRKLADHIAHLRGA